MADDRGDDPDLEGRRNAVLLAYVEALEAGQGPDRDRLLADNLDLRDDLEEFLAGQDELERLTAPLRGPAGEWADTDVLPHAAGQAGGREPGFESQGAPDDPPPDIGQLGDFRLLREVGRGGMGVVYEAEQISLRRRVALKVLPFAAAIDDRRLQRFKTEAMAAAHLQHEKIVPVHAVGCERGVHYYAMQFIEGQSLAALIRDLRRVLVDGRSETTTSLAAATLSKERSSDGRTYFERAASLGRQAAQALEHAHQAGVVHRDVKPSNLLLDVRGQLWVTDFGLAQVTGDAGLTVTGEMLGTLRYASPEQVLARRGIVDHRSDVYSLGATLYELLTLRPLFEGRDRGELLRQIADDEPPPPRAIDPHVPEELETVVLKALRKEPGDRYASAQDLADDLGRFLDGRPVVARPPTPSERLRGWARRHPSIVVACAAALVLLSAASLVSTALIRREQARTLAEQRRAEAAYRRERQRAEEAEARFRLARRSVDELIQVGEEDLANRPGMEGLRKRLLSSALAYYQEFLDQRRNDPGAQAELRDTARRVERILDDLAVLRAAGQLYVLAQPRALDDLRLDDGQRARVRELASRAGRQWMESFGTPGRLSPAERTRRALEQARANEAEVAAILTPAQQARLRQLALQAEGPAAFREPEVVAALRLSPEQRERIQAIEEDVFFGRTRTSGPAAPHGEPDRPGEPDPAIRRVLAVLSESQASRWRELAGVPSNGSLSPFPRPFAPPRDPKPPSR